MSLEELCIDRVVHITTGLGSSVTITSAVDDNWIFRVDGVPHGVVSILEVRSNSRLFGSSLVSDEQLQPLAEGNT
jgi:hypothetical protein